MSGAEMIRKVFKLVTLICPKCGGRVKVVAFITDYAVVDRIIDHLKLLLVADTPPRSHVFEQVGLLAAEKNVDNF